MKQKILISSGVDVMFSTADLSMFPKNLIKKYSEKTGRNNFLEPEKSAFVITDADAIKLLENKKNFDSFEKHCNISYDAYWDFEEYDPDEEIIFGITNGFYEPIILIIDKQTGVCKNYKAISIDMEKLNSVYAEAKEKNVAPSSLEGYWEIAHKLPDLPSGYMFRII